MIRWLYRYVFRGFGILLVLGMMTILYLAIRSQIRPAQTRPAADATGANR